MARRRFRWSPEEGRLVEIVDCASEGHFVHGEIAAFTAQDGTYIDSRTKYEDYCARNNVVPLEAVRGIEKERDRYETSRQDRAMRELLWEKVDRAMNGRR